MGEHRKYSPGGYHVTCDECGETILTPETVTYTGGRCFGCHDVLCERHKKKLDGYVVCEWCSTAIVPWLQKLSGLIRDYNAACRALNREKQTACKESKRLAAAKVAHEGER